ncbi:tripartite tricarboxylate transporter TctB family protein [Alphaproteobacteria bacterium]|nr:tripartite tricarboxylate transporter TctB family protein [Alphaproteobacteria bacterium]
MELRLVTIPAIIAVFSVIIIGLSLQLDTSPPMIVGDSMQARSFPIFLMILNIMLCVILFLQLVKEKPAPVPLEGRETWGSMVLILLFFALTISTDMFIAIPIVMFLLSYLWGERRFIIIALNSILTPVTLFFLFDKVLRIRFPRGIITNWYYG